MPKLAKQRRKKVFRHNMNRRRLRKRIENPGNIDCTEIKKAWDKRQSVRKNLQEMGICYDPNQTLSVESVKRLKIKKMLESNPDYEVETVSSSVDKKPPSKTHVLDELIEDATAPRVKMFRLPKGQVERLSNLLTKYGLDYKAMAKDPKNYNQETWKQIRSKVNRFRSIPEQYDVFLASADEKTKEKLKDEIYMSDDE